MNTMMKAAFAAGTLFVASFVSPAIPAMAACVDVIPNGGPNGSTSLWVNNCNHTVTIRWTNQRSCRNWSCSAVVGAHSRQSALIFEGGRYQYCWCEGYRHPSVNGGECGRCE
jgi:hypothetical protein